MITKGLSASGFTNVGISLDEANDFISTIKADQQCCRQGWPGNYKHSYLVGY